MAYEDLTLLQKNSLPAKTTSLLTAGGSSVEVDDQSVFYRGGVLLTKGWTLGPDNSTESYTEEIIVSATDDVTGAGTVTISARAIKADGTNGAAREWPIGTTIKNTYTTGVHDQVRDNFIEHATLITARATKTPAAMSVYVDSAATGTGDGSSWTDAFTTIQAAINSLPVILEHAVTIYVRKGSTAYTEDVTIQQMIGKGSLTIESEYYWTGECAAASTPSATKFNLTSTTGAQIAAGDPVLVRDGYVNYVISTVKATTDKGSNVWEIELNNTLPTGNISTGDYYTICKTVLTPSTAWLVNYTTPITIQGFSFGGPGTRIMDLTGSGCTINACMLDSDITYGIRIYSRSIVTISSSLVRAKSSLYSVSCALSVAGGSTGGNVVCSSSATAGKCIFVGTLSTLDTRYSIFYHQNGEAIYVQRLSYGYVQNCTILAGTTTGIVTSENSVVNTTGLTNNATTPKSPATSTDNPVIT